MEAQDFWYIIGKPLLFTIYQASLSTILTLILGLPTAYIFANYTFPGKRFIQTLLTVPFILPTIAVAVAFNSLLGANGWINILLMSWLNLATPPIQIVNTLPAILLAHVFYNTTIVIRLVGIALQELDPHIEQAGRVLGASPTRNFTQVILPLIMPSILASSILVFLFNFTSFGVILLLGSPTATTLEVEIYIQALHMLNLPMAGLLSIIQLTFTFAMALIYRRMGGFMIIPISTRVMGERLRNPKKCFEKIITSTVISFLCIFYLTPMMALISRSFTRIETKQSGSAQISESFTLLYYQELFINRRDDLFYVPPIKAAVNSILIAAITTFISIALGLSSVYGIKKNPKVGKLLDTLLLLPLGASAVTVGLGYTIVFYRFPIVTQSFPWLIPIAHSLIALPFVYRSLVPAVNSIPINLQHAASVLGASPIQVWFKIELPIIRKAVITSGIFSFAISLGEFGAASFLTRPEYPTLPTAIFRYFSQPGAVNYGQALAMTTLLVLICAASIFLVEVVEKRPV